jgi:hypothetical protein
LTITHTRRNRSGSPGRTLIYAVIAGITGIVVVAFTNGISSEVYPALLGPHRGRLTAIEIAFFGVIFVELLEDV